MSHSSDSQTVNPCLPDSFPPQLKQRSSDLLKAESQVRNNLLLNALIWPGIGTIRSGKRKKGWLQVWLFTLGLVLCILGGSMSVLFLVISIEPLRLKLILAGISLGISIIGFAMSIWVWIDSVVWGLKELKQIKAQ